MVNRAPMERFVTQDRRAATKFVYAYRTYRTYRF